METPYFLVICAVALVLLWLGVSSGNQLNEDTLEELEKLDVLEDRIREARAYLVDSDTVEPADYEYLVKVLDPQNEYMHNPSNDF